MKKYLLLLFVIFALFAGFCITADSKTEYNLELLKSCKDYYISTNEKGAYIYSFKESSLYINSFSHELNSNTINVNGIIRAVCQDNSTTYALYESFDKDKGYCIYSFDISSGETKNYDFSFLDSVNTKFFTVCDNKVYLRKVDSIYAYIESYSLEGEWLKRYTFDNVVINVFNNNSYVYAILQNGKLIKLTKNNYINIADVSSKCALYDAGIDHIYTTENKLINLNTGESEYISNVSASCIIKNKNDIIYSNNNVLYLNNNGETKTYETDKSIIAVLCYNNYVVVLKDNYFSEIIKKSDFKGASAQDSFNNGINNSFDLVVPTNIYVNDNNIIYGVKSGISVSEFKSLFINSIKVYDHTGKEITRGKIKTGYQSNCFGDLKYISVMGDITGEGNVKSNDISLFMKYIINAKSLDVANLTSCDYNLDTKIDNRDLVLISRKTKE